MSSGKVDKLQGKLKEAGGVLMDDEKLKKEGQVQQAVGDIKETIADAGDAAAGRVVYAGTGNTVLRRFGKIDTRLVSYDGVLGQNMRTPKLQSLQLEKGDLVVLYTDGVQDRFTAEDYPSIFHHAPKDVVRTIIERFGKDYDDAACIAVRYSG